MIEFIVRVSEEDYALIDRVKTSAEVQSILEGKIEELRNQGEEAVGRELLKAFMSADSADKAQFSSLASVVNAKQVSKLENQAEPVVL